MKKTQKYIIGGFVFLLLVVAGYGLASSMAAPLENDVRVEENSDLTYYLDIMYDGKDKDVISSSTTTTASVFSDYIYVEDKIPDGLIFKEFVNSADGSIGAVEQGDPSKVCSGYVVDGYSGLHYDSTTRLVSFKVKNLKAGCKLTVGITTTTPSLGSKKRMDFYNTAYARENDSSEKSNTVHVYLGRDDATLYNVSYEYTGDVPANAPELPDVSKYAGGTSVGVINDISLSGYTFSGWTSEDVTVNNRSFVMPEGNVVLKGSFTKNQLRKVTYSVTGDVPNGYIAPKEKEYGVGEDVSVDTLKPGDVVDGYRFLGWTTASSITITENIFQMPDTDVVFVGKFERIKYKVTYKFQGTVIPPEGDSLLPSEKSYGIGDIVKLEQNPVSSGYRFLGWYKKDKFIMPENDVVIYGEWMSINGEFSPVITKTITNPKDKYTAGDVVLFDIKIENNENFEIHDVMIQEETELSEFLEGEGYTVLNDKFVKIDSMNANSSIVIKARYKVPSTGTFDATNTVRLTGALADNDYYLDTTKDYTSTVSFKVFNTSDLPINPSTFDAIYMFVIILVASLVALGSVGLYVYKTKNKEKNKSDKDNTNKKEKKKDKKTSKK